MCGKIHVEMSEMILPWLQIHQGFLWLRRLRFGPVKPGRIFSFLLCVVSLLMCLTYVLNNCKIYETGDAVKWASTPKNNLNKVCWVYGAAEFDLMQQFDSLIIKLWINSVKGESETFGHVTFETGRCEWETWHLTFR